MGLMMSPYRRNLLVGVTVLGACLIFGWMILKFSAKTAEVFAPPQMALEFTSTRADGLSDGSQVYFLGVSVGHVNNVSRRADGTGVIIDATVDRKPPIPANVIAEIVQASALGGGASINLSLEEDQQPQGELMPGSPPLNAKYLGLQLNLIPPEFAETAKKIGKMSDEIAQTTKQLRESGAITDLDTTVKQINVQASKAGAALDSVQTLFADPKMRADLQQSIDNIRQTTEETNRVTAKLEKLADSLQKNSDDASVAIKDTQGHVDDLSKVLGDRLTQTAAVLDNVKSITDKIDQGKGTGGQFVNDPRLYESLVDSSKKLDATVADLQRLIEQWEQEGVAIKLR
jgi:phospholipid/cholesterol/gamma-HCH transport system substrate-binding protein